MRILLLSLLMPLVVVGQTTSVTPVASPSAETLVIGVGPDMQMLPAGAYRFITIPTDPSQAVTVNTVIVGGNVPIPPQPGDFREKVQQALAKVTDADKAKIATGLADAYAELVKGVNDGSITDKAQFNQAVGLFTTLLTTSKPTWSEYKSVVTTALDGCADVQRCASLVSTAIEELRKVE